MNLKQLIKARRYIKKSMLLSRVYNKVNSNEKISILNYLATEPSLYEIQQYILFDSVM